MNPVVQEISALLGRPMDAHTLNRFWIIGPSYRTEQGGREA